MARRLIILVIALGVIWCGYWVVGSRVVRSAVETWFADAPVRNMQAEQTGIAVRGFPNRFDVTVDNIRLADAQGRYAWEAPFVQLFALSYKPWHVIAAFANDQVVTLPVGRFDLKSDRMMGSMVVTPDSGLELERLRVEGQGVRLINAEGRAVSIAGLNIASDRQPEGPQVHRIGVELTDIAFPAEALGETGPAGVIPKVRLDATATFSGPITLQTQEVQPVLTALSLHDARMDWAEAGISVAGDLVPDSMGRAQGQLTLRIENWRKGLAALEQTGAVDTKTRESIEQGLKLLAGLGGGSDTIELPMTMVDGQMRVGFLTIGPAPYLR